MDIKLVRHQTELFAKTLMADVAEVFASVMFLLDVYWVWSLRKGLRVTEVQDIFLKYRKLSY